MDMSDTIKPKSDQLNADDLITGPVTVTIERVTRCDGDQPVAIILHGNYQPFKPCKSMRRVMVACWGNNGHEWAGKSMTLFCDPEVMYGGVKVGGIRISHVSDIAEDMSVLLTATRSKRKPYLVKKLSVNYWEDSDLQEKLPAIVTAVQGGKLTEDQAFQRLEKTARLTADQKSMIAQACKPEPEPVIEKTGTQKETETNESIFD